MKDKLRLMLVLFLSFANHVFSQGYIPVTTTIRTPMGNVPYTYQMYTGPMNYYRNSSDAGIKYNFTIVLKNDSTIQTHARIDISDSVHRIEIKKRKIKSTVMPQDTRQVIRTCGNGRKITGIPADSCWLFQVGMGKINSYSVLPYDVDAIVIAIQKGTDGPIVPLSKRSLLEMVGDDPKLNELIEKEKFEKAIRLYNQRK